MVGIRRWTRCGAGKSAAANALCALLLSFIVSSSCLAASPRTTLVGNVPRLVASSKLTGHADPTQQVSLALVLPLRDQQGLSTLLSVLYDPASPLYRAYLTSDEFAARFGPTQADYDAAIAFARSQGLQIVKTSSNHTLLDVAGTSAAVEQAFGVVLNMYKAPDGRAFRAPDRDPSIPSGLAGKVTGIVGLDTALVQHTHVVRVPLSQVTHEIGSGPFGGLTPTDIRAAYNLSSTAQSGSGETLALYELDGYTASDITLYEYYYGLPYVAVQPVLIDGFSGIPSGTVGQVEVTLDIQLMIALASGASKILVYEGQNGTIAMLDAYNQIAIDNAASQVSSSWGLDEASSGSSYMNAEASIFQEMATQGQSMYAAAGDSGAYDNGSTLSVDDPASQPFVTGVGGTTLTTSGSGGGWQSETTWNGGSIAGGGGGGGISSFWSIPSYQSGVISTASLGSKTMRNVPDVSLDADPYTGYSVYVGGFGVVGGTSCAAPLWAAMTSLINAQRAGTGLSVLGFANPTLYKIGTGSNYTSAFHDIADRSTNLYYPAVTGYDLATGWGTFNGLNLLNLLAPPGNPVPAIDGISPKTAPAGSSDTKITVYGTGLVSSTQVLWNGVALSTTYVSNTTMSAIVPASDLASPKLASITLFTPAPGGGNSTPIPFVVSSPTPTLSYTNPYSVTVGSSDTTMAVVGTNFVSGAQVLWNGVALTTNYVSPTLLVAVIPATDLVSAGSFSITVVNNGLNSPATQAVLFYVTNPTPTLTGLSPNSATAGSSDTTIALTGTNFVSGAQAQWGGASLSTTYVSSTQLTATVPASDLASAGTFGVKVLNPGPGAPTSNAVSFTVNNPAPTLTGVSPSSVGSGSSATTVTLTGTNFVQGSQAQWGGAALTTSYVSATQLTAVVPASDLTVVGTFGITVMSAAPGGGTSGSVAFTVTNPTPTISSLSPNSVVVGAADTTITITGANFIAGSQVQWNGSALTTGYVSATQLTTVVPTGSLSQIGTFPVTVFNPAPGGGTSSPVNFAVYNATATLSSVSPSAAIAGSSDTTVTLVGSRFVQGAQAQWNGSALATAYVTSTQLTAVVPAGDLATAGVFTITVSNPSQSGPATGGVSFTVNNATPTLTGLSPSSAVAGSSDTTVTLTGTNFVATSTAQWNGGALKTTYVSATQLTAVVPASDLATAGTFSITVSNPSPGGGASGAVTFTVNNPTPTLSSVSPKLATAGSGSITITLTGSNFVAGSQALWGGAALATTYGSATQLTATVPASDLAAAGMFNITVANPTPGGGVSNGAAFEVDNPTPTLSGVSPSSAVVGSPSVTITLTGSNFVAGAQAEWNGSALTTTYGSATQLTAVVPAANLTALGTFSITVVNPGPSSPTSGAVSFIVRNPAGTLLSVSPNSANSGSAAITVTLTGSGFLTGAQAQWNGSGLSTTYVSGSQLTAVVPAGDLTVGGTFNITVVNPGPGSPTSGAAAFTVKNVTPSLASLSPNSTTTRSTDLTVTAAGKGFVTTSQVLFDGTAVATTYGSGTSLAFVIPASSLAGSGAHKVTVTNPAPGGGTTGALTFSVSNAAPTLSSTNPGSASVGSSNLAVTASGTGFVPTSQVQWDGKALATTYVSGTTLNFVIPTSNMATSGTHKLTVKNPAPGGGTSGVLSFSVTNPAPTLTSIYPGVIVVGSASVTITVRGAGFIAASQVQFDGTALSTRFVSTTEVQAFIPMSYLTVAGGHKITVRNPAPNGGTTFAQVFTVYDK